jgi:hypothetical protein
MMPSFQRGLTCTSPCYKFHEVCNTAERILQKNTIRLWIEATGSCKWQVAKPVMAERIDAGQKDLKIEGSQAVWNKAT